MSGQSNGWRGGAMPNRLVLIFVMIGLGAPALATAQQRCVREYHPVLKRWEERCSDGTKVTDEYNRILRQREITIEQPSPTSPGTSDRTRCVESRNVFGQIERVCE